METCVSDAKFQKVTVPVLAKLVGIVDEQNWRDTVGSHHPSSWSAASRPADQQRDVIATGNKVTA